MRYRITIEIEADSNRLAVNRLAMEMKDHAVTAWSNPVFVSTEIATPNGRNILVEKDDEK